MAHVPDSVLRLAEDVNFYAPLRQGDRRIVTPGYVVFLRLTPGLRSTVVTRLRLGPGEVAAAVREVRALLQKEGRPVAIWEVGSSATPASLPEQLVALGMKPAAPPFVEAAAMVLPGVPPELGALPADVRVTPVTTLAEFRLAQEIFWRGFEFVPDDQAQAALGPDFERFTSDPTRRRYLAWQADRPVAAADATLTDHGVLLHGSVTLPAARSQGVYRALIGARWQEAVRRCTPYLFTQAGALSKPVLARVGFVETARIKNFIDPL